MKYTPLSDDELAIFAAEHDGDPRVTRLLQERRLLQDIAQRRLVRCTELEEANRALRGVVTLRWKRIGEHSLPMPQRAMVTEAGHDLPVIAEGAAVATGHSWACPDDTLTIFPGALVNFRSGWAVEIPPSHFGLVHVRSSVGKAQWVLASSGVIDPSYRGRRGAVSRPHWRAHGADDDRAPAGGR